MSGTTLSDGDRSQLLALSLGLLAALLRYHRGLARLEVECFMLPPRIEQKQLFSDGLTLVQDGEDALVEAAPWMLRFRRDAGGNWDLVSAGRACADCGGSGACAACANLPAPSEHCSCGSTGLCERCQGIGKELFF